jgi:hypothetical protein
MHGSPVRGVATVVLVAALLLSGVSDLHLGTEAGSSSPPERLVLDFSGSTQIPANCTLPAGSPFDAVNGQFELASNYLGGVQDYCAGHSLDGDGRMLTYESGFTAGLFLFEISNVTVSGFTLTGPGTAVELLDDSDVTVTNDSINTSGPALSATRSTNVIVAGVNASRSGGIVLENSNSVSVEASDLSNATGPAVQASAVDGLAVTGSDLSDANGSALEILGGADVQIDTDDASGAASAVGIAADGVTDLNVSSVNLSEDPFGVEAQSLDDASFWENTFSGSISWAYTVNDSQEVTVTNATVLGASAGGIYLADDTGVSIYELESVLSGTGVEIDGGSGVTIADSNLSNGGSGVAATGVTGLAVSASDLGGGNNGFWGQSDTGVRLSDSNLSRANYPLNLTGSDENVLVVGSELDTAQADGAYLDEADNVTIESSSVQFASTLGVASYDSEGVRLVDDDFAGSPARVGPAALLAAGGTGLTLTADDLNWTATPITVDNATSLTVQGCGIANASGTAIQLSGDQDVALDHDDLANGTGAGIDAGAVTGLSVARVDFDGVADDAVLVTDSSDIAVNSSTFLGVGSTGVFVSDSAELLAENDSLPDDGYAFFLTSDNEVTVASSNALDDSDGGLAAAMITGFVATGDNFSADAANDVTAFAVSDLDAGVVSGCTFDGDFEGLSLESSDLTVVGNSFDGDNASIAFDASSGGLVYHNDFVDDTRWVLEGAPSVAWNAAYPVGGNYWSNYTGSDRFHGPGQNVPGPDGIGDTPFVLNASEVDEYPLMTPWVDHDVVFTESGLPAGVAWSVEFNGTSYGSVTNSLVIYSAVGAFTEFQFAIPVVDGLHPSPSAGSGMLDNGTVLVPVEFRAPTFVQTFTMTGLPANASWAVVVNAVALNGVGPSSVAISLPNGTYPYTVAPLPGYSVAPSVGVLHVAGSDANLTLRATVFQFEIRFVESGLPLGLSWNLVVNGTTGYSSSATDAFLLANGSYSFSVNPSAGYTPTPSSGTFTVQGSDGDLFVHFAQPGSSRTPPSGGAGSSASSGDYWPYEVAIGVAAALAAAGWGFALLYRRRLGRGPR